MTASEIAKLIHILWPLKQTKKLGFGDGLTGFDLDRSAFHKTTPECRNLCGSHERPVCCL